MYKQLRFLTTMLLLAVCCGTWAQTTYKLTQVTSVEAGGLYVFEQDGYVMNNTVSSSALQTTNTYETTGLTGTETYVWTLVSATNGFYMKNVSKNESNYLYNGSGTNISLSDNQSIWKYTFQDDGTVLIQNTGNSNRFLGYTTSNSHVYKAYATTNLNSYPHAIKVYKLEEEQQGSVATPTFSLDAGTYNTAQSVTITTATAGATIYYTTNGDVPSITSNVYASAIEVASTMTIKAIAVKDGESSAVAEATYTIVNIEHAGTEADPYTVADARAAIDANTGITNVYATGIVSEIVTAYNSQYGNITYNISADGTTTVDQLEVYRGKSYDGADFTSDDDIQVGDVVVVYGTLQKYGNTYEFAQDNQLVSLQRPVITTPSISLSETTIEATADETDGTIDVTYNNITNVAAEVVFYEEDGETTTSYDWITADINNDNNVDYIIEANTGEARTAYMKVYALDDEANDVYSELITITQDAYVAPVIPTGNSYVKVTSTDDITTGQYLIVYEGNDTHSAVAFNGGLETLDAANNTIGVTIENNEIAVTTATEAAEFTIDVTAGTIKSASGLYIGKTAYSNGLDSNANTQYTNSFAISDGSAVITASGNCTLRYNYASDQARFRYYKSGQQAIQLYKKETSQTVTVSSAGYATYVAADNVYFPEDVTAYIVSEVTASSIKLTEVLAVEKDVPVVVKATAGTYDLEVVTADDCDDVTENKLLVSDGTVSDNILVLANKSNGVGFYTWAGGNLPAGKVYLVNPNSSREFFGFDEGVATSISTIDNGQWTMDNAYNLQGQKVGSEYKGIIIVNGKKFINK